MADPRAPRKTRIRFVPFILVVAALVLGAKAGDLVFATRDALAKTPAAASSVPPASAMTAPAPAAAAGAPPAVPAASDAPKGARVVVKDDAVLPNCIDGMTPSDVKLYGELKKRREEIEARAQALDSKALLLEAAEKRVDQKIVQLKAIQDDITQKAGILDATEKARVDNLVKIYETMKPEEAAAVLQRLEMKDLLEVFGRMKSMKAAPILGAMDPDKARAITAALLQKKAPGPASGAPGPTAPQG